MTVVGGNHPRRANTLRACLLAASAAFVAGAAGEAQAQVEISPNVGYSVAGGEFGAYTTNGPSLSLRVGYAFAPGKAFFVEGGLDRYKSSELTRQDEYQIVAGPDMKTIRLAMGLERELMPSDMPDYQGWSARLRGGVGVALIESDVFRQIDEEEDLQFESTSPMVTAGLALGYTLGRVTAYLDGGVNWAFVDEDKTEDLAGLAPLYVKSFGSAFTYPYSIGLRVPF